jgi:F0F1-type ATP synthase assembly protein I
MHPSKKKSNVSFLSFVGMAFQMIATILVFTFLGLQADKMDWIKSRFPIFTLVGIFAGLGVSFYSIFKSLKNLK